MVLYIKNMVCRHCIDAVRRTLNELRIPFEDVQLGEVRFAESLSTAQKEELGKALRPLGFELLSDKRMRVIEQVKTELVEALRAPMQDSFQLSAFLQLKLGKEYSAISKLFSEVEGMTLERYFILLKVERIKELMVYDELSLAEIADQLGYSSPAHLSSQFKQVTGLPPSHFKKIAAEKRLPLNEIREV
ncbi:MAG: AraC family transcriptional regulator [Flavobacteriales bacterium]